MARRPSIKKHEMRLPVDAEIAKRETRNKSAEIFESRSVVRRDVPAICLISGESGKPRALRNRIFRSGGNQDWQLGQLQFFLLE